MTFIAAISALWILFYTYWFVSAIGVKKAVRATPWWKGAGLRLLLVMVAIMLTRTLRIHQIFAVHPSSIAMNIFGVVLCVAGLTFAVWARVNLGRKPVLVPCS